MRRIILLLVAGFCVAVSVSRAEAAPILCSPCLFYSGDFNGVNGLSNELNTTVSDARVYDNAIVDPAGWSVTGIFTNNLVSSPTSFVGGHWEIRSGVSAGDGGTLVASGDVVTGVGFSMTPNGQDGFGFTGVFALCDIPTTLLNGGVTYWFSCTPRDSGTGRSFQSFTSGAGSVGTQLATTAFFDSIFFGTNFQPEENAVESTSFSFGVIGTAAVPEPASLSLLGMAVVAWRARVARAARRRT